MFKIDQESPRDTRNSRREITLSRLESAFERRDEMRDRTVSFFSITSIKFSSTSCIPISSLARSRNTAGTCSQRTNSIN